MLAARQALSLFIHMIMNMLCNFVSVYAIQITRNVFFFWSGEFTHAPYFENSVVKELLTCMSFVITRVDNKRRG